MTTAAMDPERPKFEAALVKLESLPSKTSTTLVTEFLPRYIQTLRALGYAGREAEKIIRDLDLGETRITVRMIREWWAKPQAPTSRSRGRQGRDRTTATSGRAQAPETHGAFLRDRRTL